MLPASITTVSNKIGINGAPLYAVGNAGAPAGLVWLVVTVALGLLNVVPLGNVSASTHEPIGGNVSVAPAVKLEGG
jgi:hypothetical protein